jgi:hypothetical protein
VRAVPRLCELYPGIFLTTEEKERKNLVGTFVKGGRSWFQNCAVRIESFLWYNIQNKLFTVEYNLLFVKETYQ